MRPRSRLLISTLVVVVVEGVVAADMAAVVVGAGDIPVAAVVAVEVDILEAAVVVAVGIPVVMSAVEVVGLTLQVVGAVHLLVAVELIMLVAEPLEECGPSPVAEPSTVPVRPPRGVRHRSVNLVERGSFIHNLQESRALVAHTLLAPSELTAKLGWVAHKGL